MHRIQARAVLFCCYLNGSILATKVCGSIVVRCQHMNLSSGRCSPLSGPWMQLPCTTTASLFLLRLPSHLLPNTIHSHAATTLRMVGWGDGCGATYNQRPAARAHECMFAQFAYEHTTLPTMIINSVCHSSCVFLFTVRSMVVLNDTSARF
jgi:hypothetical protein